MKNRLIIWTLSLVILPALAQTAAAWNQGTHRQINYEAVQLFFSQMEEKEKYQLGPITDELRQKPYRGIAAASSGLLVKDYQSAPGNYTMPQWITLGGDWADEPHLYSSLRHFYDPFSRVRPYLTDQWLVHGVIYESPGIDAKTWGLDHPDNPFSFKQGLTYYKLAMEVNEDVPPPGDSMNVHFKTNLIIDPLDPEDQRGYFLAMAYRALGESMHMLGDMTQPAHVRNDAHPLDEPIETRVFSEHVRNAAADPLLDPRITPFLASAGGGLQWPEQLFDAVAAFTNKTFYSADTIYDQPSLVIPNNYSIFALPYPEPQFADLKERYTRVQGHLIERRVKRYEGQGGAFDWMLMPMAQERLSFHWFDPDQSIWIDHKEVAGRFGGNHGRYHIPNAYAPKQARVLLPIAIYANADLMDMFFPTLELTASFTEEGIQNGNAPGSNDYSRYVVYIDAKMEHDVQQDDAWSDYNLKIEYTGPATLIISEDEKPVRKRKLYFKKGKIDKIEMPDGSFKRQDLELYSPLGERQLTEEEAFYQIENMQSVHVMVEAGTRRFESKSWVFEKDDVTVNILPPRSIRYIMSGGATQLTDTFEAVGRPEDVYRFEWHFGDGKTASEVVQPGETSKGTNTYINLVDGDVLYPEVKLYNMSGDLLAEDTITLYIEAEDEGGNDDEDVLWRCDFDVDYSKMQIVDSTTSVYYWHVDGKGLHGPWLSWSTDSRDQLIRAECYYEDKLHGPAYRWFENGNKKSETPYNMGEIDGVFREWWENGNLRKEHHYHMGERHGSYFEWHENGIMRLESYYEMGKAHGPVRTWHENGNKHQEGTMTNGLRTGIWVEYSANGTAFWCVDWDIGDRVDCP